jgi:hypothetical protein
LIGDVLSRLKLDNPVVWLVYNAFHDRHGVDEVVARTSAEHGIALQPIMVP